MSDMEKELENLKIEKQNYIQIIEHINAEKIALDECYVDSLKAILNFRKEILFLKGQIEKLKNEINSNLSFEKVKCDNSTPHA